MTLFPFLSVGFLIMSIFSVLSVRLNAHYYQQWSSQKIWIAFWACCCPLLATSSALGLLFWFGFRFGTILAVTPFLVLAIGVDDAYLMLHSWFRLCANSPKLDNEDLLKWRVAEMLADTGPSITITSATNILAFTVGIFSPVPEIQLFCAGNAVAIFADYLYQIFVFVPVLVLLSKRENNDEATKNQLERRRKMKSIADVLMTEYCQWLCNRFTSIFVLISLSVYWFVSLKGVCSIEPKITPKKLFLSDSIINDINELRDDYVLPGYTAVSVFVNNAGNLSDIQRLNRIHSLIGDFEQEPQCSGANFTHFWLRDFEKYVKDIAAEEEEEDAAVASYTFNREQMESFLAWPEYKHWKGFMRFNDTNGDLEKFFVIVAFRGPEMVAWKSRGRLLNRWRSLSDNYPDLEAFVWVDEAASFPLCRQEHNVVVFQQFLDQIETLVPSTVQSSIVTLICMALVCLFFMCNMFTLAVATMSVVSICLGVLGFLPSWNIDLDPISMATTIMSIGFSIDFPAHLTYHYYKLGKDSGGRLSPEERIYHALATIGYPLIQCGLSTILFVTCLLFVDTYMSEVFVKTLVLVVSLGLIHALLLVPCMLCAFSRLNQQLEKRPIMDQIVKKIKEKWTPKEELKPSIIVVNRNSILS